jgi:hypothetical protein
MDGIVNVKTITDSWVISATICAGILSAVATVVAVVWTNKKTAERYEKEKELQGKTNAMVIVKPNIK